MHIYLDESGDLGFDFDQKKPSSHFVMTLLVCDTPKTALMIKKAVERTLKNKLYSKKKYTGQEELKGTGIPLSIKVYFYQQANRHEGWRIYSIILDKKITLKKLIQPINKHRLYNVLANHLLKQVNFSEAMTVNLFIDRSKSRDGIKEFDEALRITLDTILPLNVPLEIGHVSSHKNYGIQAVDLFCWGISRRYTSGDELAYDQFKHNIVYEQRFLP